MFFFLREPAPTFAQSCAAHHFLAGGLLWLTPADRMQRVMSAPIDPKAVQAILSSDLRRAVALYGEAWFLSMRKFWPACAEHEDMIADVESRAGTHVENPFVEAAPSSVRQSRSFTLEVQKIPALTLESDVTAWLEQFESICVTAGFNEAAWISLATASMDKMSREYWDAVEQQVLDHGSADHVRQWQSFKIWGNLTSVSKTLLVISRAFASRYTSQCLSLPSLLCGPVRFSQNLCWLQNEPYMLTTHTKRWSLQAAAHV